MILCGLAYQFFGNSELQSWNTPEHKTVKIVEMAEISETTKAKQKEADLKA